MLARRKAKLPFYLNALREKEYAEKYPGCLLNNFHNLLRFWQRHYLNKDKDSTCLENVSSSLSFLLTAESSGNTFIRIKPAPATCGHLLAPLLLQSVCKHTTVYFVVIFSCVVLLRVEIAASHHYAVISPEHGAMATYNLLRH